MHHVPIAPLRAKYSSTNHYHCAANRVRHALSETYLSSLSKFPVLSYRILNIASSPLTASCMATAGISEFCCCIAAASHPIGSSSLTPYSSVGI